MAESAPTWFGTSPGGPLGAMRHVLSRAAALLGGGETRADRGAIAKPRADSAHRNMALMFGIRVGSAGILFLSQIVLARWMGAAEYGLYVSLWTAVVVGGGLCHLGLNMAMIRLIPEFQTQGRFDHLRGLLLGGRAFTMVAASFVTILVTYAAGRFVAPFDRELASLLALAALCLPAYALTDVQDGIGRGQGWAGAGLALPYLVRPLMILVVAVGAFAAGYAGGARTAVAAAVIATWVTAIAQTLLIENRLTRVVPRGPARFEVAEWLRVSLPLLAVGSAEIVLQNADVLLLNAFRPSAEVGVYYAAAKTMSLTLFVHYAVGSAFARRIAEAGARNDDTAVRQLAAQAVRWTFWPSALLSGCMLLAGPLLLDQFGHGFVAAYPLMFVLAIGMLVRAATGPSEIILNMLGHQTACARSFGIAALVAIGGNLVLIPLAGVMGAAIATSAAFATAAGLNWWAARAHLGIDLFVGGGWLDRKERRAIIADMPLQSALPLTDGLSFEIADDIASLERLAPEWNSLFARHAASHQVFLSHRWLLVWARQFTSPRDGGSAMRPAIVVVRRKGDIALIWPLSVRSRFGMRCLCWAGMPVSQYGDVLADPASLSDDLLRQAWEYTAATLKPDLIHLRKVRADAAIAPFLSRVGAVASDPQAAPYMDFAGAGSYAAYEQRYSGKARKNRRRLLRRLEEQGTVTISHDRPGPAAVLLAAEAITMKRAWLVDRGLLSPTLDDPRTLAFFQAMCAGSGDERDVLVSALSLDGVPCAIMIAVAAGDRIAGHIFTYDLKWEKSGVGVLLLEDCLRQACDNGYRYYDLLAPSDAYKLDWSDAAVAVCDHRLVVTTFGALYSRVYLGFLQPRVRKLLTKRVGRRFDPAHLARLVARLRPATVARA